MNIYIEADSIAMKKMSGIGHATLEITRAFDVLCESDNSLRVTVLVPYGKKQSTRNRFRFKNIRIRTLPPGYKYVNYVLTRTSLPVPIDIWYGKGVYIFPNYKTWWVPFSRSITFVHDLAFQQYPETINPKNLAYLNANFNRWLKRATKIATISKSSADDIASYYPEYSHKTELVYLGVDTKMYSRQSQKHVAAVKKKYQLPKKYLLFIGNVEPRKNITGLLAAYKKYCDQESDRVPLVIVGGGGWNNEDIISEMTRLKKLGYDIRHPQQYVPDEDLPALYSGASLLVHVAIHEGFGLSLVQAMACGLPVIAGDNSSIPEVVGDAALLVDAHSAEAISDTIIQLLGDKELYKSMQSKGIMRAREFSWAATTEVLLRIARDNS